MTPTKNYQFRGQPIPKNSTRTYFFMFYFLIFFHLLNTKVYMLFRVKQKHKITNISVIHLLSSSFIFEIFFLIFLAD